jgi:hypothetical protein
MVDRQRGLWRAGCVKIIFISGIPVISFFLELSGQPQVYSLTKTRYLMRFQVQELFKEKQQNKKNRSYAQVGIRIRVDCVTGNHDRPLHYLGTF